eukprot:XP_011664514.1 PREDICTED: fibropellin-3-like [Strongylocentrotus purpuratus]
MPVLLFFILSTLLLTEVTAVGECDSGPCMNGATCGDQYADAYTCLCVGAFQGRNCEVPLDVLNLGSGFATCDDYPFICIEVSKGSLAIPNFGLSGGSNLVTCQAVTCRGVEITQTLVSVLSGALLEGKSQDIVFNVDLTSESTGGTAEGANLWRITTFGSVVANGLGTRLEETTTVLSTAQSGTTLRAGASASLESVTASWNLMDGPTCSEISHFCVEVAKGTNTDFELIGVPSASVLIACTPISCREIDECASGPCLNGGTCIDNVNSYSCECASGYADIICSTDS